MNESILLEGFLKFIGDKSYFVEEDGTVWKNAFMNGTKVDAVSEYLQSEAINKLEDSSYKNPLAEMKEEIQKAGFTEQDFEDSSRKETGMKWVSVKEKLPDVGEGEATEVIINSHVENAPDKDVSLCGIFYKGDFYVCANWEGGNPEAINPIRKGRVSHWMPIPELSQSVPPYKEEETAKMSHPLINILIRHKEGRELTKCFEAILSQTYKNHRSIISLEDFDFGLVDFIPPEKFVGLNISVLSVNKNQHYNLHCNDLKKQVTDGWFFFMDDDDYLASPTVLEELSKHLFEGALIVQFLRKNNRNIKGHDVIKPTDQMIEKGIIKRGVVGGGCLCLHYSFKDVADWLPHKGADYDWIKAVTDKVPTRFVKLVLQISEKANLGL